MFFCELKDFFIGYGIQTCAFSVGVFVFTEIISAVFKGKLHSFFNYLPFVLGIAAESVYLLILGSWNFNDALSLGLVTGSLSEVLSAVFYRIKSKRSLTFDPKLLLIEGIVKDFAPEENVKEIAEKIVLCIDDAEAVEKIAEILSPAIKEGANAKDVANLIVTSVLALKEK